MEMINLGDKEDQTPNIELLMEYLPDTNLLSLIQTQSAGFTKLWDARTLVLDRDKFFQR